MQDRSLCLTHQITSHSRYAPVICRRTPEEPPFGSCLSAGINKHIRFQRIVVGDTTTIGFKLSSTTPKPTLTTTIHNAHPSPALHLPAAAKTTPHGRVKLGLTPFKEILPALNQQHHIRHKHSIKLVHSIRGIDSRTSTSTGDRKQIQEFPNIHSLAATKTKTIGGSQTYYYHGRRRESRGG
jgi:hypothetical protein